MRRTLLTLDLICRGTASQLTETATATATATEAEAESKQCKVCIFWHIIQIAIVHAPRRAWKYATRQIAMPATASGKWQQPHVARCSCTRWVHSQPSPQLFPLTVDSGLRALAHYGAPQMRCSRATDTFSGANATQPQSMQRFSLSAKWSATSGVCVQLIIANKMQAAKRFCRATNTNTLTHKLAQRLPAHTDTHTHITSNRNAGAWCQCGPFFISFIRCAAHYKFKLFACSLKKNTKAYKERKGAKRLTLASQGFYTLHVYITYTQIKRCSIFTVKSYWNWWKHLIICIFDSFEWIYRAKRVYKYKSEKKLKTP